MFNVRMGQFTIVLFILCAVMSGKYVQAEMSAEGVPEEFEQRWYRGVRMNTWMWAGAQRQDIESALERIQVAQGPRRWDDKADTIIAYGPGHWTYEFSAVAKLAYSRGQVGSEAGEVEVARTQFLQASMYYTIASYPHLRDENSRAALALAFNAYERAGEYFEYPLETLLLESDGVTFKAHVHLPKQKVGQGAMPVVLKTGGMDVLGIEFYPLYKLFSDLGIAMITFDMPGTGNDGVVDDRSESHHVAMLEWVLANPKFDPKRVAVWSESLGGLAAVKVAITQQQSLTAVANSCGLIHAVHTQELGGLSSLDLVLTLDQYRAGKLSDEQVQRINKSQETPQYQAQRQGFQFEVYLDRVRARSDSFLDLLVKSYPVSLQTQGLIGHGMQTQVPILSINTHADPIVPISDSVMVAAASALGTLILVGDHDGHCVARSIENPIVVKWLTQYLLDN